MSYEIVYGHIKKSEKQANTEILKINAAYPKINAPDPSDKFAAAFNSMYERAAECYIKFAETTLKKAAESKFAQFEAAKREKIIPRHEKFIPFGAVFKTKAEFQSDGVIRVNIDASVYPGKSKRISHAFDPKEMKFLKPKVYL